MSQTANPTGLAANRGLGTVVALVVTGTNFFNAIYANDIQNVFMNTDEFGETISVLHTDARVSASYKAIYDDPHLSGNMMSDAEFNTFRPQIQISEHELLQPIKKGDRVTVRGIVRFVDDVHSDGVGVITVYMRVK